MVGLTSSNVKNFQNKMLGRHWECKSVWSEILGLVYCDQNTPFIACEVCEIFAWSSGVEWSMKGMSGGGKRNAFAIAFLVS